ncbi:MULTISPECIES: ATP-grasp domain-containing protein [Pseudomonadaceae]|uniref:ATP-grasp domain-containing protein n=1 Tax=Pseudomonadaceae TaxID=135621 RepID=UPI00209F05A7|nr:MULTISPECIES: ATP-grasp domain-containing protein [Pseudomonas]MCP1617844.1 hypothetical protein [Pseudomonas otitidis]
MTMHLLYPCAPDNPRVPDETFAEEFAAATAAGLACSLFSCEELELQRFKPTPALGEGARVLYRGWMLTPDTYRYLTDAIASQGAIAVTDPAQYRHCHHLPEWYPHCRDLTPATLVLPREADFAAALADTGWTACFVKDYVKSLTTQRGSVARNADEVIEILTLIERYRGALEGGVCLREFEPLKPDTEERYFVLDGRAFGRNGEVPALVHEVARRVPCPFFSVDLVASEIGALRLVELGDGQVSDRKQWPADRFVAMLQSARG